MSLQNFKIAPKFHAFYVISLLKILQLPLNFKKISVMSPHNSMSGFASDNSLSLCGVHVKLLSYIKNCQSYESHLLKWKLLV
jgi:hypothetical protein